MLLLLRERCLMVAENRLERPSFGHLASQPASQLVAPGCFRPPRAHLAAPLRHSTPPTTCNHQRSYLSQTVRRRAPKQLNCVATVLHEEKPRNRGTVASNPQLEAQGTSVRPRVDLQIGAVVLAARVAMEPYTSDLHFVSVQPITQLATLQLQIFHEMFCFSILFRAGR